MTAQDRQALDILVEMVKENASTNSTAHQEIITRLDKVAETMTTTFGQITAHCSAREKTVNAALLTREKAVDAAFATRDKTVTNGFAALAPKKYTLIQVAKSAIRLAMLLLAQAAVTVGILAAVGVFNS
jgi:hypothetical protein